MFQILFSSKDVMLIPTNHWLAGRRPTSTSRRTSSSSSAPSTRTPPLTQRRSQEWVNWKLNLCLFLEGSIYEICRSRVFWPKPSWRVFAERKVVLCVRFSWGIKGIKLVLCCHTLHWESFLTFQCGWHFHTTFWISSNVRDSPHLRSDLRSVQTPSPFSPKTIPYPYHVWKEWYFWAVLSLILNGKMIGIAIHSVTYHFSHKW